MADILCGHMVNGQPCNRKLAESTPKGLAWAYKEAKAVVVGVVLGSVYLTCPRCGKITPVHMDAMPEHAKAVEEAVTGMY